MKKLILIAVVIFLILGCGSTTPSPAPKPTQAKAVATTEISTEVPSTAENRQPINTAVPTVTLAPANTPVPTDTPASTNTTAPTDTPLPTATSTPPPQPIVFSGSGDTVLDINKWQGPAIAHLTHTGQRNFIVESLDADNNHVELLVNTIGDYTGTVPVDFENTETERFTIDADGAWEVQILPLSSAQVVSVPGNVVGTGDLVIILEGATPDKITADASQASRNFAVQAYNNKPTMEYLDLLANEIAPYTGVFLAPKGTTLLVIAATGPWKLEITGR